MKDTHIQIVLGRRDVEAGNLGPVLAVLDPARLPAGEALEALHGRVLIDLGAVLDEDDELQLYEMPAARAYARALWRALPHLCFFLPLDVANLWLLTACVLDDLVVVRSPLVPDTRLIEWGKAEMDGFVARVAPAARELCARAG